MTAMGTGDASSGVVVRVPAKVNLALRVGPLRRDGFHELATVFHAVSLYDEVVVRRDRRGSGVSILVEGDEAAAVPTGRDNLAARAVLLAADEAGVEPDVEVVLRKGIPVAGGMAGGSADAAAALLACATLWDTRLDRAELGVLAAQLGSDVPFPLVGGTAVGTGRGERLTPALARGSYHWVVALAEGGLSTPAVFGELDRLREGSAVPAPAVPDAIMSALRQGDADALGAALVNDLERAALSLRPELAQTLEVGLDAGALGGMVSGSGPTCAFLVAGAEQALDVAVALSAAGVCRDVRRARGPVSGATVVGTV